MTSSSAVASDTLVVALLAANVTEAGKMPVSRLPLSVTVMSTVRGCPNTLPDLLKVKSAVDPSVTVPASARTEICVRSSSVTVADAEPGVPMA